MLRSLLAFLIVLSLSVSPAAAKGVGTVSSADPRATEAGMEMLRKGGSATDAAMAMMLALTVVEPQSSGIGGGGFLLHHDAHTGLIDTIDGRETAPASATPSLFLGPDRQPLPFGQAFPGGKSVGVPGNIALMKVAHDKWGKLQWADLFAPAIRLAREGFVVNRVLAGRLVQVAPLWENGFSDAQAIYWINGKPAPEGATIKNLALADFLEKVAANGPDAFYKYGTDAITRAVAHASRNATQLTATDLANYRAKERPSVCAPYRAYKICGMGPPSSGATTVLQILGMLERFDLDKLGKDNPKSWHLIGEAMQLAYADRAKYLGDRDFVAVPIAGLIDPTYIRRRSALISPTRARTIYQAGTPPSAPARTPAKSDDVPGTTHFVAVDSMGNIVSMTSTVEGPFGSQLVAHGFFLNNELTDFDFSPEEGGAPVANRVEPGKRPLSSMSPTIVYDAKGQPIFVVGAAGGKTIIMQVAKAIIAKLDWGMDARDAIGLGLLFFDSQGLTVEQGTTLEQMKAPLEAMGHHVGALTAPLKANAAERLPDGSWRGAADPRSMGLAVTE
jgi:gamma-glutamyltranspeptidase/glutathione hydrolase